MNTRKIMAIAPLTLLFLLSSCERSDGLQKYVGRMDKALSRVVNCQIKAEAKAGAVTVYSLIKNISVTSSDGKLGGQVTIAESRLNEDFGLTTTTDIQSFSGKDAAGLLGYNLTKATVDSYKVEADVLKATVLASKAADFFQVEGTKATSDISFEATMKDEDLTSVFISYTSSTLAVTVAAEYSY